MRKLIGLNMTPRLTSLANARPKTGNDNIIGGRCPLIPIKPWQAYGMATKIRKRDGESVGGNALQLCVCS